MTARSPFSPTATEGKRLNSPNDVVVKSDGSIWFTDPSYGILTDYEGRQGARSSRTAAMSTASIRATGQLAVVADDFDKPNGLAFSPDEQILYVADTGAPIATTGRITSAPSRYPNREISPAATSSL